jgi:hypothetical protein
MTEITTHRNTWDVLEAGKLIEQGLSQEQGKSAKDFSAVLRSMLERVGDIDPETMPTWVEGELDKAGVPESARSEMRAAIVRGIHAVGDVEQTKPAAAQTQATPDYAAIAARHKDPAYREQYARELLTSLGRNPDEVISRIRASEPAPAHALEESTKNKPTAAAAQTKEQVAERESAIVPTAREAAMRAVLENEMDKAGVPESQRGELRANLEATLESARTSGTDLGIPEPMTVDRSTQIGHSHEHSQQISQVQDGVSPDLHR